MVTPNVMVVGIGEKFSAAQKKATLISSSAERKKKSPERLSNKGLEMKQIKRITDIFKGSIMISIHCTMAS